MFKIKGREVIEVNFDWTLDDMEKFMEENWDKEDFAHFERGKPTPMSIEEYIYLPATPNCLVIAYPRKGKVIFTVADNANGAKLLMVSSIPNKNPLAGIAKTAVSINRAKEMKGPAAAICEGYAEHMKELLKVKGLL